MYLLATLVSLFVSSFGPMAIPEDNSTGLRRCCVLRLPCCKPGAACCR